MERATLASRSAGAVVGSSAGQRSNALSDGHRADGLRRVRSGAAPYSLFQRLVGAKRSRRLLVSRHVRPVGGERVLDVGCGPGDLLDELPSVDYLGVDLNPRYVDAARRRYGDRGRFKCADVRETDVSQEAPFDLVLGIGILHHLDDGEAHAFLRLAASALGRGGRVVTFDGVFTPGQPRVARWLMERDRGQRVRTVDGYMGLVEQHFASARHTIAEDLLHVPYTHIIIEATEPRASYERGAGVSLA
jgi:SAM-dependent methyltransferase